MKRKQVKKLLLLALCACMAAGPAQTSVYADTGDAGVSQIQTEDQTGDQTEDEKDDLSVQESEENAIQIDVSETAGVQETVGAEEEPEENTGQQTETSSVSLLSDDSGNYALNAEVTASEHYQDDTYNLEAKYAVDGDMSTRWGSNNNCKSAYLELTLKEKSTVNSLTVRQHTGGGISANLSTVSLEYKTEGAGEWQPVENAEVTWEGTDAKLFFNEVSAQYFKITMKTVTPQPGLNIAEVELRNEVRPERGVDATDAMEGFPASNLTDGKSETMWKSEEGSAQITLTFTPEEAVNTVTIEEDPETEGKLSGITVEYWNGSEWVQAAVADCSSLPMKKNIFFDTVTTSQLRLTFENGGDGPMAVKEITVKESAEDEMPADTDLITLEPDIKPNKYQQQMVDNGYTMFIHFGLNTFTEDEWTYGNVRPSVYNPTEIDADQWVKTAKEAGMKTVLLVSKHHDGFCLWDSAYTEYDVGNPESGSHENVIKAVSDACNKYGINLGLYYSAWDNNWDLTHGEGTEYDAAYNEYMRNQITELLNGDYGLNGQISELWIDGIWEKDGYRWEFDKLYDTVKTLQPACQIGLNHTIGDGTSGGTIGPASQQEGDNIGYFPSDFRIADGQETRDGADADPKLFTYRGETYYLPFEATLILNQSWFWHTGYGDVPSRSPESIVQKYNKYKEQGNILVLNCGPNREGKIEQADIDSLYAAARMLGIASGDALKKTYSDVLGEYKGENLALNAAAESNQNYTGSGSENHMPEKMFDGNTDSRWATNPGNLESVADITLDGEKTFNYLIIREASGYPRTDSVKLEYQDKDGNWQEIVADAVFSEAGQIELRLEAPVTATNLRLTLTDQEMEGPTIAELELYYITDIPELTYTGDTELEPGDSTELDIVDTVEQASFKALAAFTSDNEAVASVDENGVVTAVAEGTANITARLSLLGTDVEVTIPITVQTAEEPDDNPGENPGEDPGKTPDDNPSEDPETTPDQKPDRKPDDGKKPGSSATAGKTPQTGDPTQTAAWAVLLTGAGAGIVLLNRRRKAK